MARSDQTRAGDDPSGIARQELKPGERLVWAGRPHVATLAWRQLDLKACLLAAPAVVVGFILVWQAAKGSFASVFDYLFVAAGVVALCVAVLPVIAPLRAARRARHTVYAITDQRLFILELFPRHRLRSFAPNDLEDPRWRDRGKGLGDVTFGSVVELEQTRQGQRPRLREATFFGIANAQRVEREIAKLKSRATA